MEGYIAQITEHFNIKGVQTSGSAKISEDGSTLICECPVEECALIFTKQYDQWVFQQKLTANDGVTSGWFGYSVSISSDGNTALIGAHGADPSGISDAGAAYVFIRNKTWVFDKELVATRVGIKGLGADVHVLDDSRTIIVKDQSPDPTFECYARMYNGWLSIPPELLGL